MTRHLALIAAALAVVSMFVQVPFVSEYAFWLLVAAFVLRDGGR
jgi:hypothetical protein